MRFHFLLLLTALLLLFSTPAESQLESSNWNFGPTPQGLHFSAAGVVTPTSGHYTPYGAEGCSVLSDPVTGNLQFYTDGSNAIDAGNAVMPNGAGLLSLSSSEGTGKIAADPANCNRFYIFHNTSAFEVGSATRNLYYSVVDMTLPGNGSTASPKGDVVPGMKNVFVTPDVAEGLEIVPVTNSHDFWLLVPSYSSSSVSVLKFTSSGVTFMSTYPLMSTLSDIRPMRYCSINNKIAIGSLNDLENTLLLDFNPATGVITSQSVIPGLPPGSHGMYYGVYGLEWSSDGSKLYISKYREGSGGGKLYQHELSTSITTLIYDVNPTSVSFSGRGLKRGPDAKIYFLYMNTASLVIDIGVVNNPNNPGLSCNFNPTQITMPSNMMNANKFPDFLFSNNRLVANTDTTIAIVKPCSSSIDSLSIVLGKPLTDSDGDALSYQVLGTASPGATASFTGPLSIHYVNHAPLPIHDTLSIKYCDSYCVSKCDTFRVIIDVISAPGGATLSIPPVLNACAGTTISVDAGPGLFGYSWSSGDTTQTITVQNSGSYSVTAQDSNGCMYADSTSIVFNPLPTVSLGNDTAVCGSIVLNAGFPFAGILWNSGNTGQLETAGTSGLYYVQVTDANGCTAADSVNVTIHALPVVDIGNDTSICGATSFTLSTNQSYPSILWSNGGATQTITIFSSGIYSVSVQDSIGCTSGDSVQVLLNSIPSVDLGNDTTLCGGSLTLSTVLNYPFISWSNGDNTLTTVAASSGLYSVSIQDINGCTTSDSINVIINPVPSVFIGNDTTICGSSPVTLSTNQFFSSILWSNGATTQNNIISTGGLYYVTVSDVPGCSASDSIVIVYHPFPVVDLGNDTTLCGSYTADAGQPFPFISWSDGSTSQTDNITVTGTYYVAVADVFGCPAGDTVSVIILPAPVAGITGPVLICEGATESYSASAAGGSAPYQYAWSNADVLPATQITFTAISTTISVTVTDANGCSDNAALVVTAVPDPVAILSPGFSGCAPVHAGFLNESTNAFSYLWDFGDGTTSTLPDPSHEYAVPGSYNITLITTNSAGCSDTLVAYSFVNAFASPLAAISTSGNVSSEHPVLTVSDSSHDGDNCVLYFGDGTSMNGCGWNSTTHTYEQEGDYTLTQIVVNADGCADTATVDVNVSFENTLFAPSAFTPNGSGHNDVFFIYGTGLNDFRLTIYDRWGEKIFESNDMLKGWDGTYKGRFVEQDVYVWKADYTTRRMGKQQRIGHVTVVK